MATSGSTNYSVTRNDLIDRALRILGVTAQGTSPTSTQYTESGVALNGMVKAWQADGMPLWGIIQTAITMTSGVATYRIGEGQTVNTPKPLKVISAFNRHVSSNSDTPMMVVTRDEYQRLGNKATTGIPFQLWYNPLRTYGDLYLFPTPSAIAAAQYSVYITYQRPFEDFDTSTDEPDFPQEWFDALAYGLADRLAPEYGLNTEARADLSKRTMQYRAEALSFGTEEGSFYFQRDTRNF